MDELAWLRALRSPQGQEALTSAGRLAETVHEYLPLLQALRPHYPDIVARAAAAQALLRRRARAKFSRSDEMYFSRESLEQATAEPVARHRATRFQGRNLIFDLGCGQGGDALALAEAAPVVAVDRDRARLALLQANAEALGLEARIRLLQADLLRRAWDVPSGSAAFFDPGRRESGRRLRSASAYQPPLNAIVPWVTSFTLAAIKVSPGIDAQEIRPYDCEVEFVSLGGELKEAVLWFGAAKTTSHRATVLPGPHSMTACREPSLAAGLPLAFLYEPDPAILRAGLVRSLGERLGARMLDPTIAYLTSDTLIATPLARAYRVHEFFPFQLKRLRARLRELDIGTVTVKKRGSAIRPEDLRSWLRLRGSREVTVVLTRVQGKPFVILARPASVEDET